MVSSYCADTKQMAPEGLKTEFWYSENWAYNAQTVRNPSMLMLLLNKGLLDQN